MRARPRARERVTALPCPNCGAELSFLEQYRRHFCHRCQQYAPEGYGERGPERCPACGGILSYIAAYDRFYCYRENAYAVPKTPPKETPSPAPASEPLAQPSVESPAPPAVPASTPEVAPVPTPVGPRDAAPASAPSTPAPMTEEKQLEELDEELDSDERPPLKREHILEAKKPFLIDLCKAYELDPSGTKEQLRERLLSYLEEEERNTAPTETPPPVILPEPRPATPGAVRQEAPPEAKPRPEPPRAIEAPGASGAALLLVQKPEEAKDWAPAPAAEPAPTAASAVVLISPLPSPAPAATPAAELVAGPALEPSAVAEAQEAPRPREPEVRRVEHPCPTCGRELDYISRYDRWYCHICRAYAPASSIKHACPSCGATLRWIEQYDRWWCDACRRYGSVDLPAPRPGSVSEAQAVTASTATTPAPVAAVLAVPAHKHRSPVGGIGLIGLGLGTWLAYEVLVEFPVFLGMTPIAAIPPDVGFLLRFSGFLFVALGAITGLAAAKSHA